MKPLFYCDDEEFPLPEGHKFPVSKYRLTRELLAEDGVFRFEPAPLADTATIALAHDSGYVNAFLTGTIDGAAIRRIGFPWSPGLVRRTLRSVGGTLKASGEALGAGWGGNLAGGTHHAFRACGSGFCVFNDIAVSICALRAAGKIHRAAVVDLDVHQGDGTASIFDSDADVFTISVHARNNFPFRKQRSRVDVELEDGTGDGQFLSVVREVIEPALAFAPDMLFYQSGVDGLATDRLGKLRLTLDGLRERDRIVIEACQTHRIPLVITLGGGYSEPIALTAQAHANTFRTAARIFSNRD